MRAGRTPAAHPQPERGEEDLFDMLDLPSGTILRFAFLAIAVLTASLEMSNIVAAVLLAPDGAGLGCWFAIGDDSAFWQDALAGRTPEDTIGQVCLTEPVVEHPYARGYVGTALVLTTAVAVYWLLPRWRSRRRGLVPVEQLDDAFHPAALRAELDALVNRAYGADAAWPSRPPHFVVNCTALDAGAVAFGRLRAPVVCLHVGLLVLRDSEPEKFRAVVLHELAHIRTYDVGLAYLVLALWRSFVALILFPYLLVVGGAFAVAAVTGHFPGIAKGFWPAALPELTRQAVKGLVLTAVVLLARADTLRHRELVADNEAVRAGADRTVWEDAAIAEWSAARSPGQRWWRRGSLLQAARLLRSHPSWQQRLRALRLSFAENGPLPSRRQPSETGPPLITYELSLLQFFLIGCTVLISANTVARAWGQHLGVSVVEGVASGIVLLAAWHALTHARLTGRKPPSGLTEGLALGCGLMVGQFVAGIGTTSRWWPAESAPALTLLVLPAVSALWITWIAQNGYLSLLQGVRPSAALCALGLPAWALGLMLIGWWQTNGYAALAGHPIASPLSAFEQQVPDLAREYPGTARAIASVSHFLDSPVNDERWAITGMVLWGYPVLVQLPRLFGGAARRTRTRTVMYLNGVSFRGVAAAGLAGGLLASVGIFCTLVPGGAMSPDPGLDEEARLVLLVWWSGAFICGGSVVAAVLTATRPSPVWMPRAAVAAAVAHSVGLLGFVSTAFLGGCGGDRTHGAAQPTCGALPPHLWQSLPTLVSLATMSTVGATLAAVGMTLVVRGVRRAVRWTGGPTTVVRPCTAVRSRLSQVAVGGLLVVTVASCTTAQEIDTSHGSVTEMLQARQFREPVPSLSTADRTRSLQVLAWERAAGRHVTDVLGSHNDVRRQMNRSSPDITALHTSCKELRVHAELARRARPFPEPGLHGRWADSLRDTASAADTCLAWTHVPTGSSFPGLAKARTAIVNLVSEFVNRVLEAGKYWN